MTKKCTFLYDKSPSFHDIASIPDFIEKPQIALLGSFPNDPKIWGLSVNDPKNWGLWNTRVTIETDALFRASTVCPKILKGKTEKSGVFPARKKCLYQTLRVAEVALVADTYYQ